jgi:hypothetical protein
MIRPEFRKILTDQRGAAVILWSFFTIAIVVYLVIARHLLSDPDFGRGFAYAGMARAALWILALVDLAYYFHWKKTNLTPEAILRDANKGKMLRALDAHKGRIEERAAGVVSTYVTRRVVLFAIIEAIAVYGLVLALVGRYVIDLYMLSALALVLLILEFPAEKPFLAVLQRAEHK